LNLKLSKTCLVQQKAHYLQKKEWKQGFLDFLVIFQKYKKVEKDIKLKE